MTSLMLACEKKEEAAFLSLMLACKNTNEVAAAELLEATKKAGALDLQVTEQTWRGVCG